MSEKVFQKKVGKEGKNLADIRKNYGDWLDEWLDFRRVRVKESTYIRYRNMINNHIRPYLGKYLIQEIDTFCMETYVSRLLTNGRLDQGGGLSPKSILDILTVVKESFRYAGFYGVDTVCCFEHVSVRRKQKEMRVLSWREEKELVTLLLSDIDSYKVGVFLSLYTGIRLGELCALQWKDVSLTDKTIKICKTMQRLQKPEPDEAARTHIIITEPKSPMAKRMIPLPDFVVGVITAFESLPDHYVLTGSRERFAEPRTMHNRFKTYINQSGIEDANFHSLRHTFATRCIESGFDIKSLSEILGHSSVKITLDKYVHSSLEQKRINMDKLKACY